MTRILGDVALALGGSLPLSLIVKATIVAAGALVAAHLAGRSRASVRHLFLAVGFVILLLLPVVASVAPERTLLVRIPTPARVAAAIPSPLGFTASGVTPDDTYEQAGTSSRPIGPAMSTVGLVIWLTGTTIFLVPLIGGLVRVHRIRRNGVPWQDGHLIVAEITSTLAIHRRIHLLLDDATVGPMTCGVVRPVIVVPREARTWARADLRCAIVHELEHIRRLDWLMLCIARSVCAMYWFHPLVWVAWRRLRLEAERACDDAVLVSGSSAERYADQLVTLAERLASHPSPSLAMANRGDLAGRVTALLDEKQQRGKAGTPAAITAFAVAVLLLIAVGPVRTIARAQDGPSPAFDAATIKATPEENAGDFEPSIVQFMAGGRFRRTNSTLRTLVRTAYGVQPYQVVGGPDWVDSNRYDIEAVGSQGLDPNVTMSANPNRAQILRMLQTLLADRFKLRVRHEVREGDIYHLVATSRGSKLKPATESTSATVRIGSYTGRRTTAQLADYLGGIVGRPVTDRTGLMGVFEMQLQFTPALDDPNGVSVFAALREQLGLELDTARGPVETYVILDAQPPSEN